MKGIFEFGVLLVVLVVGFVLFEKYAAQATTAANATQIASANRMNAWTGLGVDAGETAIDGLSNWLTPGGSNPYGGGN
jgi:hypothetical protein